MGDRRDHRRHGLGERHPPRRHRLNHPLGIVLASLLFGALFQGGAELDFEFKSITREMVLVIQGLIILFSGALAYMFNPPVARLLARFAAKREVANV